MGPSGKKEETGHKEQDMPGAGWVRPQVPDQMPPWGS